MRKMIIFVGIGVLILFTVFQSLHSKPRIPRDMRDFVVDYSSVIDYEDKKNAPLTFIGSGYKCIAIKGEAQIDSLTSFFKRTPYYCEWGFYYDVWNNLSSEVFVKVTFRLEDKEGFVIAQAVATSHIRPNEIKRIQKVGGLIGIDDAKRVEKSGWRIWHQTTKR